VDTRDGGSSLHAVGVDGNEPSCVTPLTSWSGAVTQLVGLLPQVN